MASFDVDNLAAYANPPTNYIGSALFLSYIALALYCSFSIALSLYTQYSTLISGTKETKGKKEDKKADAAKAARDVRARHIKIYAFLASISFAMLSYHMLNFLIASYSKWAGLKSLSALDITPGQLKRWMLETPLFENFAKELVRDGPSTLWTQVSILGTWFWNIWMGQKSLKRGIERKTMLSFIILSQILPISFTVTLFIVQLHLSSPDISPPTQQSQEQPPKTEKTTQPPPKSVKKSSLNLPTILLNASLLALPRLQKHPAFIPLVIFARLILLLPYSGRISLSDIEITKSISVCTGFVVANWALMKSGVSFRDVTRGVWTGGEALKALGWDAQFGLLVNIILNWGGGV